MTKAELVASISDRTGLTRTQAREALDAFTGVVTESLKRGEEVRLVGFGAFTPVARKAGTARNPKTGQQVQRPASNTCRFRIGDGLKTQLNG